MLLVGAMCNVVDGWMECRRGACSSFYVLYLRGWSGRLCRSVAKDGTYPRLGQLEVDGLLGCGTWIGCCGGHGLRGNLWMGDFPGRGWGAGCARARECGQRHPILGGGDPECFSGHPKDATREGNKRRTRSPAVLSQGERSTAVRLQSRSRDAQAGIGYASKPAAEAFPTKGTLNGDTGLIAPPFSRETSRDCAGTCNGSTSANGKRCSRLRYRRTAIETVPGLGSTRRRLQ